MDNPIPIPLKTRPYIIVLFSPNSAFTLRTEACTWMKDSPFYSFCLFADSHDLHRIAVLKRFFYRPQWVASPQRRCNTFYQGIDFPVPHCPCVKKECIFFYAGDYRRPVVSQPLCKCID